MRSENSIFKSHSDSCRFRLARNSVILICGLLFVALSSATAIRGFSQQPTSGSDSAATIALSPKALMDLDITAQNAAGAIELEKMSSVVVFGASGPGSALSQLGVDIGDAFSAHLKKHANGFLIFTRDQLRDFLHSQRVANSMALSSAVAEWACPQLSNDGIILTSIEALHPDRAVVNVYLFRVNNRKKSLAGWKFEIPLTVAARSEGDQSLFPPKDNSAAKEGTPPNCDKCGRPAYHSDKHQGDVMISALITLDGLATDIFLEKPAAADLDAVSIDTVRNWKFKPATNKDKEPVAQRIQINLSYKSLRSYR